MSGRMTLIFPGQGSQYVGMGLDLYERYPKARAVFDDADRALGFELSTMCFEGPEESLNDTINTQAAILTMSVATLQAMGDVHKFGQVSAVAGHSLGEYSALVAAGRISFDDAVRLVRERGRLMKEAGEKRPGGMAAVLGLDGEPIADACRQAREETGTIIQIANHNSPLQTVISGERKGLERAVELIKEKGARRVVRLAVSIASHCDLMESAAEGLHDALDSVTLREGSIPVIGNVTASFLVHADDIREELVRQVVSPVQWVKTVRGAVDQGVKTFVEIGPKDTLANLVKRISSDIERISVGDVASVDAWRRRVAHQRSVRGE